MVLNAPRPTRSLRVTWDALPEDYRLSEAPAQYVEQPNVEQPMLAAALTDALGEAGLIQPEMLIASSFGLVATVNQKVVVKGPRLALSAPCIALDGRRRAPQLYPHPLG